MSGVVNFREQRAAGLFLSSSRDGYSQGKAQDAPPSLDIDRQFYPRRVAKPAMTSWLYAFLTRGFSGAAEWAERWTQ